MNRHIVILALIAIIAAGVGLSLNQESTQNPLSGGLVLPGLAAQAEQVTRLSVERAEGDTIEAKRQDQQWLVTSHGDYPADAKALSKLVRQLTEASKVQAKTARAEAYHRLGLDAIDEAGSMARRLTLEAGDKRWRVLVGERPTSGHGQYVRLASQEQSYLIDQSLELPAMAQEWMQQPILSLDSDNIQQVRRTGDRGWRIFKASQEQDVYLLAELPDDRQLKYATVLNSLPSNLTSLNFEQQWQEQAFEFELPPEPVAELVIALFDDSQLTLSLYQRDEDYYVKLDSKTVSGAWQGRIYGISGFTARQIDKVKDDFLKPLDEEQADGGQKPVIDEGAAPQ